MSGQKEMTKQYTNKTFGFVWEQKVGSGRRPKGTPQPCALKLPISTWQSEVETRVVHIQWELVVHCFTMP